MPALEVLEGVFEELAEQRPELRRKRVRVIVLPEAEPTQTPQESLYERLKPWIGCIDAPAAPPADQAREAFLEILDEKYTLDNK